MSTLENEKINDVVSILKSAQRIFVLTGAGVSAESGVPTFRGGGNTTVWRGMPFEQLSSAEMIERDLPLVWEWFDYRGGVVGECLPNAAHQVLAQVQQSGRFAEFSVVTQNIDGLHQAAGAEDVIELHGSINRARCLSCKTTQPLSEIPADERPPVCPECFDSMRPDIILFGEAMPMEAVCQAQERAEKCDVCIVIGTSALVYPAAELPLIAKQNGAKIIEINLEETQVSAQADVSLRGKAGEILPLIFAKDGSPDNRLPNANSVQLAAERTRREKEAETSETMFRKENASQNDQSPEGGFMTSASHPLRVVFLQNGEFSFLNKLGLTFAPGKKQRGALSGNWNRDLASDLIMLRGKYHTDTLISLVESSELKTLGIENLEAECRTHSIELIRFPLPDVSVPLSLKSFAGLIREIVKRLMQNKTVVIHCKGGLGRAGLAVACTIVAASGNKISGEQAIKMVREVRGAGAVETKEQENFISLFGEYWQLFKERTEDILRQQKTAAKEKVLEIGREGSRVNLYRFKTKAGKWYFFTEGSSISLDENDDEEWISRETEPVESLAEGIDSFQLGYQIFHFQPIFIHPEIRAELERYLENLYDSLSAEEKGQLVFPNLPYYPITPGNWIHMADMGIPWKVGSEEFVSNEDDKTNEVYEGLIQDSSGELSHKHFLLYWQERNVRDHEASGYPLDVVSSRQLKRANAGDCLWIVTINSAGELILAGRLKIGEIVDYKTAVRRLNDANLWDGGFYALPADGEAEYLQPINIKDIQLDLRFANSEADRFVLKNGKINAQQLQTMRELSMESADLLDEIWESVQDEETGDDSKIDFNIFDEQNDPAELLRHCRRIVDEQPDSAEAHYNLGVALDQNDLPDEAKDAYLKAVELDVYYWSAYYNLGQYYLRFRELKKAEDAFIHTALLAQNFAPAHFMLGVVYGELKNFHEAIAATERGLAIDPNDPKAYFNLGNFYFHLHNYGVAVGWLEHSLELAPDEPPTLYRLGECYRHLDDKRKEFNAFLQVADLTMDLNAFFALGTIYAHLTETAEGSRVPYFESGGTVDFRDSKALFHFNLGNLALGNVEEAQSGQRNLREIDVALADRLQFFIDRFEDHPLYDGQNDEEEKTTRDTSGEKSGAEKSDRQKRTLIEFYINNQRFETKNIPEMYKQALVYLVDNRLLEQVSLPVATGEKRYILAAEPVHPSGKPFLAPVEYNGYFMEAHNNRVAAIAQLKKLVESVGCTFSEVFNFDPGTNNKPEPIEIDLKNLKKFQGCLLGGAVGDAMGAAIEFDSIAQIRQKFGEQGLTDYAPAYGRIGAITDDTQMTLFTAEGLLRANSRYNHKGICHPASVIYFAYLRWLETQGIKLNDEGMRMCAYETASWLRDLPELNSRRAPGNSCLSALKSGKMGTVEEPINNSKGCGGVMRVAPIGLYADDAFGLAVEAAAITHGHPTGYLSAGVLALIIQEIIKGKSLTESVSHAVYEILPQHKNHEETFAACDKAIKLANNKTIQPSPETVETLGGGWIAEEALAISIYCALVYENDFKEAILLAVNHSGDSDSTGAITGNILGALHGMEIIPEEWLTRLELKTAISEITQDLLIGFRTDDEWWNKYPGV